MNGRELSTYSDETNNISYKYNLNGIRTSKTVNGITTNYYLEGSKIVFEDRNNTMLYYLYNGDEQLGFVYNSNTYYYHKNIFGDIIGILNSNYEEIVTYEYDSWGAISNITDTSGINLGTINPFRYRSYYYDEETKLYYLNSRYYNPEWGRFVNGDSIILANKDTISGNIFQYVSNNWINLTDYSGNGIFNVIFDTIKSLTPFYAAAAAGTTADGPLPYVDMGIGITVIGVTAVMSIYNIGNLVISNVSFDFSLPDSSNKKQNSSKSKEKKVTFPSNPCNFKPKGLVVTDFEGTGNGRIIKWSYPGFKDSVFEWHEDYAYGSHYHITEVSKNWPGSRKTAPHYKAGDVIPEPYASIYFGG